MKTLKFMLAVATAVGLASAAQATQYTGASTGFEKLSQGDPVKTGVMDNLVGENDKSSYFCYAGENEDDNESEIVKAENQGSVTRPKGVAKFTGADATSRANALQVSTGTDPLLRTIKPIAGKNPQPAETFEVNHYVDTLVQFTVTPATDTVTPSADDKLMIYLKETVTGENDDGTQITSTNLVVKAGFLKTDYTVEPKEFPLVVNDGVEPGVWYRLTIEAIPDVLEDFATGSIGFQIRLNGSEPLQTGDGTYEENPEIEGNEDFVAVIAENEKVGTGIVDGAVFLSLLTGAADTSALQAVGFAGEGYVDDLVITTTDPSANVFNFTLSLDANVTAIDYTIGGQLYSQNDKVVEDVVEGAVIEITSVTYATGYEYDTYITTGLTDVEGSVFNGQTGKFSVTGTASLSITAKAAAASGVVPGAEAVVVGSKEAAEALPIVAEAPEGVDMAGVEYASYFKKVITDNGDGTFSVTAELDETALELDVTVADLVENFDNIEGGVVTIKAKPGLYYSVEEGSDVKKLVEGEPTQASGGTVELKVTKFPGSGFYKVKVNITK